MINLKTKKRSKKKDCLGQGSLVRNHDNVSRQKLIDYMKY